MITVNERWIILSDSLNYIVCRNKPTTDKKTGKVSYPSEAFFKDFASAVEYVKDREIQSRLESDDVNLTDAVRIIRDISGEFINIFKKVTENGI